MPVQPLTPPRGEQTHDDLQLTGQRLLPNTWKILASGGVTAVLCVFFYLHVDQPVALAVLHLPGKIAAFFSWVTHFGNSTAYLVITGAGFLLLYPASCLKGWGEHRVRLRKLAWVALFLFVAVAASGLLVDTLKVIFSRYRPVMFYKKGIYGFALFKFAHSRWSLSFPSGHADTIFALMTALFLLTRRYRLFFFSFAVLVAISRVLVGAHFPSDILAGSYLGVVTTLYLKGFFLAKGINIFPDTLPQKPEPPGASP